MSEVINTIWNVLTAPLTWLFGSGGGPWSGQDIITINSAPLTAPVNINVLFSGLAIKADGSAVQYRNMYLLINDILADTTQTGNSGDYSFKARSFSSAATYKIVVSENADGSGASALLYYVVTAAALLTVSANKTIKYAVSGVCKVETNGACTVLVTVTVSGASAVGGTAPYLFTYAYVDGALHGPTTSSTDSEADCCLGTTVVVTATDANGAVGSTII
jgi:hypothetical protein